MLDFSDSSGQFSANCFEEEVCQTLYDIAQQGGCALLHVELDIRPGDDQARVTIRGAEPLEQLRPRMGARWCCDLHDVDAVHALAHLLAPRTGGSGQLTVSVPGQAGETVDIALGSNFQIDAQLIEQLAATRGIANVRQQERSTPAAASFSPRKPERGTKPQLRLVS
jgi:DNA polymerase-3 subunit alpha